MRYLFQVVTAAVLALVLNARAGDGDNEYQFQLAPTHKINDRLTSLSYFGYINSKDENFETYVVGLPGVDYRVNHWLHLRGVWYTRFTDHEEESDTLELRPSVGFKASLPHDRPTHYYNLTRFEFRALRDLEEHEWSDSSRVRSRFGIEVPLASRERAWKPGTWYALMDVEPYYQLDGGLISPINARLGLARVVNDWMQIELFYTAQYTRSHNASPLEDTGSIFLLNIKVGLQKGVLNREHAVTADQ